MRIHRTDVRNVNFERFRGNLLRNSVPSLNLTPLYHYRKVYCLKFRKISSWWLLFIVERILPANCAKVSWLSQNSAFSWLDSRFKIQKYVNVRQKIFSKIWSRIIQCLHLEETTDFLYVYHICGQALTKIHKDSHVCAYCKRSLDLSQILLTSARFDSVLHHIDIPFSFIWRWKMGRTKQ